MEPEDLTRQYLEAAAREWATLEAGDATVPLTDVFVLLEAVERPRPRPTECAPDLAALKERLEHASPLPPTPSPLLTFGQERGGGAAEGGGGGVRPLSHALRESRHLVLLGEPGAGKTTTLQYIALWFARRATGEAASLHADLEVDEPCVPVRLDLRVLAPKPPASGAALEEALAGEVDGFLRKGLEVARDLVRHWRDSGRLLPLLDGLDEVPEAHREEARREISRFAASPDGSRCRVVVASRIAGYAPLGGDFREYTLKPFQRAEEARDYLAGWLAALRPEWGREAEVQADRLLAEMGRTGLRRVTDNPLLLRMAAELYARRREVARSRAELYRRWVEEAWARALRRGARPEERKGALDLLEEVAWAIQNGLKLPELSPEEKSLLRERMGLLARLGEEQLAFAHRTFQEYFVARRLARAWQENRPGAWAFIRPRLHLPEWREPLLLLAGELEGPEATDLVRRVLRAHRGLGEGARYERYLRRDLLLALRLAGEARELVLRLREQLVVHVRRLWGREFASSNLRRAAAEALGKIGDPQAVPALLEALKDKDWRVRRAAAGALGEIGDPRAVPDLLEALKDEERQVRWAAVKALGKIGDPQAVPALLEVLRDADAGVRRAAAEALGEICALAVPALLEALRDENADVRRTATWALGEIGDPQAVPGLLEALRDEDVLVRRSAAWALGRVSDPRAVPALREVLKDENADVRQMGAWALGKIGDPQAVPVLLEALKDKDWRVRSAAAEALGEIGDPQAVPALRKALRDWDIWVCRAAAEALGKIGDPQAVPGLLEVLRDENVRKAAAGALGEIGAPRAVPGLLGVLGDENVRKAAVRALGKIGDPQAVPALLEALRDEDADVRRATAEAMGKIGAPAVPALLEVLRDVDEGVRRAAAKALGEIGDSQAVPALLKALRDEDAGVRGAAAWALGEIGDSQAVPALQEALRDEDADVRRAAAEALGEIGDSQAVPALLEALRDTEWWACWEAAKALGEIARALKPAAGEEERREQAALLRRVARALYRARRRVDVYDALQAVLEKPEALTAPYFDPFAPLPVPAAVRAARAAGLALAAGLLLAVGALLGLLSGAAGDVLKEQAEALLRVYPAWVLVLLVAALAALAGGLSWALDRLRKR